MIDINRTDDVIRKEAHRWNSYIQQNTLKYKPYWTYEDLVQEGWIAAIKAHEDFDETRGATFIVFLWQAVRFRFQNIYHKKIKRDMRRTAGHYWPDSSVPRRSLDYEDCRDCRNPSSTDRLLSNLELKQECTPEDYAILSEMLDEVSKSSKGLVEMIIYGVSERLLVALRRRMRHTRLTRNKSALGGSIIPNKEVIEKYFSVKLDKICPKGL